MLVERERDKAYCDGREMRMAVMDGGCNCNAFSFDISNLSLQMRASE